jgi:hypothetical protein
MAKDKSEKAIAEGPTKAKAEKATRATKPPVVEGATKATKAKGPKPVGVTSNGAGDPKKVEGAKRLRVADLVTLASGLTVGARMTYTGKTTSAYGKLVEIKRIEKAPRYGVIVITPDGTRLNVSPQNLVVKK